MYSEEERAVISIFAGWTEPKLTKAVLTARNYGW